jgi:N-acyl homoserine lactone hydrolase
MTAFSIWVLEYGYVDCFPASNLFAAQPNEGHRRMPYCFALLRSTDRCVLVDTGFADEATYRRLTDKYGDTRWAAPVEVLERAGIQASQVDAVALTHNHFDHAGCAYAFPSAHVYIQRREVDCYKAALHRPRRFEFLTRTCETLLPHVLAERERVGLLTCADGELEIATGLEVRPAHDTHTAGSQVIAVLNDADGPWVFAGDNMYSYENLEGLHGDGVYAPIAMSTGSPTRWLEFADAMLASVGGDTRRVIPFHEQRLWDRFPSREFSDGLHVAEISLAAGHSSVLG